MSIFWPEHSLPSYSMSQQLDEMDRLVLLLGYPDRIAGQDHSRMLGWWRLYAPQVNEQLVWDIGASLGQPDEVIRLGDKAECRWDGACTAFVELPFEHLPTIWLGLIKEPTP